MISKFASMRESWFTKIILTITALSFMSLFGVSGYINSANNNKAVIKVGDIAISQSEFSYAVQKELAKMRAVGMEPDEDGKMKAQVANALAQTMTEDAIIENLMQKYNVDFTDSLVRQVIMVSPQFLNANGQFDREVYKWYLNKTGQTEQEMIAEIKRNMARKILIDSQVAYANVPEVMVEQMQKVLGQRRTFNYIKVAQENMRVTRQPDDEELDTIYDDFAEEFEIPEKRNVSVFFLSMDDIEKNIEVSAEEINAYYEENIDEFEQPEQRDVLQMVFENEEDAKAAAAQLAQGADFMDVVQKYGQNADDVQIGFVARADLSDELADIVFSLSKGQASDVVKIADGWQILKVVDMKAASKTDRTVAEAQIAEQIRADRAYDGSYEVVNAIEDKIGAGAKLEDIAKEYNSALVTVNNLAEDGTAETNNKLVAQILKNNKDAIDSAFTYNEGEITQAVEDDNGILLIRVEEILPTHQMPREEATARLKQIWYERELASVTQETADNVAHDLEQGDSFAQVAARYGLKVMKSMPISRNEKVADLTPNEMFSLFGADIDEVVTLPRGNDFLLIAATHAYDDSKSLSDADKVLLLQSLHAETSREMSEALLKDFASQYEIEVKTNRMGLGEE